MAVFHNRSFENRPVPLDGEGFQSCSFKDCRLVYAGGALPSFADCTFDGCSWQFQEAAERTILFVRAIVEAMGAEGATLIENLFPRHAEAEALGERSTRIHESSE